MRAVLFAILLAFLPTATTAVQPAPCDDLLTVRVNGKYGLIDRTGDLIIRPEYESIFCHGSNGVVSDWFSEGLLAVKSGGRWGYVNTNGESVIRSQYEMAGPFSNGMAQVGVGDEWGMIRRDGSWFVEPRYSYIGGFVEDKARVAVGGTMLEGGLPGSRWGFLDRQGREIVAPTFDYVLDFERGLALVNVGGRWTGKSGFDFRGGRWGVIDKSGSFVLEPKIEFNGRFPLRPDSHDHGLFEFEWAEGLLPVNLNGRFGFVDQTWQMVIQPRFDEALPFSEDLAAVRLGELFGYIDTAGNWIIKPQFSEAHSFSEGLAGVKKGQRFGFIDKKGKLVLTVDCDTARSFEQGVAHAQVDGLWGVIDRNGRFIIQPQFSWVLATSDGFYLAETPEHKRGLIDRRGRLVVQPRFDWIGAFHGGFAFVGDGGLGEDARVGIIDETGRLASPLRRGRYWPGFDLTEPEFEPARKGELWGVIDENGTFIIEPQFTRIKVLGACLLGVRDRRGWGLVDMGSGELVLEPSYYRIGEFSEGVAVAQPRFRGPVGYIDQTGKVIIEPRFSDAGGFKNGVAHVVEWIEGERDLYYIDRDGLYIWHPWRASRRR